MASPLEWNTAKPALVITSIKQYMASPLEWNTAKPALVITSIKQYKHKLTKKMQIFKLITYRVGVEKCALYCLSRHHAQITD
jgi:hypothetical protein